MRIYNVSNYSKCGSYFASYLQFVLIIASNETEALEIARKECEFEKHNNFQVSLNSDIELNEKYKGRIIYQHYESDYR